METATTPVKTGTVAPTPSQVPPEPEFRAAPHSWYYLASLEELKRSPQKCELPGNEKFVGFIGDQGQPIVLSGRCSHMGADLSRGCVKNGRLVCPLHAWEYNSEGRCEHIPASDAIPTFARQTRYPVAVRGGHVFFFNQVVERYPMPFFEGEDEDSLVAAEPFDLWEDVPWYLVGANGFDRQHFENTHDRKLLRPPVMDAPHEMARRSQLDLGICGTSVMDRVTRTFAGTQSRMTVTSWCGTLIFAAATLNHARTFGIVAIRPLPDWKSHARVIVWVRKSRSQLGRLILDPLNASIRRRFIQAFFQSDLGRLAGIRYQKGRMIASDQHLVEYLEWLRTVQQ